MGHLVNPLTLDQAMMPGLWFQAPCQPLCSAESELLPLPMLLTLLSKIKKIKTNKPKNLTADLLGYIQTSNNEESPNNFSNYFYCVLYLNSKIKLFRISNSKLEKFKYIYYI